MQQRWEQQRRKVFFPYLNDRMWRNPQLKSGVPGMLYLGKWLCIFSNPSLIYNPLLIFILLFQTQLFRRVMPKKATWNLKSVRRQLRLKGRPMRLRARARRSPSKRSGRVVAGNRWWGHGGACDGAVWSQKRPWEEASALGTKVDIATHESGDEICEEEEEC